MIIRSLVPLLVCAATLSVDCPLLPISKVSAAEVVDYYGYDDCIELKNDRVRVVLCPAAGGRVLNYSLDDENVLYLPSGDEGWRWDSQSGRGPMNAGRFDIGPEKVVNRGQVLWMGPWTGEITGQRSARLTSQFDPKSGARLVRDFELAETGSRLICTQTIRNESAGPVSLCHWSRTFAVGGGIAVVPRSPRGRFPNGYTMYGGKGEIMIAPEDPNIQSSEESVIVSGAPAFPKLGFDSLSGWLAYLAPTNQMFVKRFRTYPDRAYNEFAGLTISVWYPQRNMVELEPIGPAENLQSGQAASFSEEWWLLEHPFPDSPGDVEFADVEKVVQKETQAPSNANNRNLASPEVLEDGSVTFRFAGGNAGNVDVSLDGKTHAMSSDQQGGWSLTTDPLGPGIHEYTFRVDGARITDPRNRWVKKWIECASLFEIPGDPPPLTQQQDVPHGTLHRHLYDSEVTGDQRALVVYTPPGYSNTRKARYPVLVLCHGFGDDETAWTEVGRANLITDNLIANLQIEPLVIVMPNGHPVPLGQRGGSRNNGNQNSDLMNRDIAEQVIPLIESAYHVRTDASGRAIAGLSMGGGHAITTGLGYPDLFQAIGAFSSATPTGDLATDHPNWLAEGNGAHKNRKLFWIACGTDDFLLNRNRGFTEQLNMHDVAHTYVETKGGHSWRVWREYLPQFLELFCGR